MMSQVTDNNQWDIQHRFPIGTDTSKGVVVGYSQGMVLCRVEDGTTRSYSPSALEAVPERPAAHRPQLADELRDVARGILEKWEAMPGGDEVGLAELHLAYRILALVEQHQGAPPVSTRHDFIAAVLGGVARAIPYGFGVQAVPDGETVAFKLSRHGATWDLPDAFVVITDWTDHDPVEIVSCLVQQLQDNFGTVADWAKAPPLRAVATKKEESSVKIATGVSEAAGWGKPFSAAPPKFCPGSIVRHKLGGPVLMVSLVSGTRVVTTYEKDGELRNFAVEEHELERFDPEGDAEEKRRAAFEAGRQSVYREIEERGKHPGPTRFGEQA